MSNDIYSYIKDNFGIKITDYQFKRDYIKDPLRKIFINHLCYKKEYPNKEDLEYLFSFLSCNQICKLFNIDTKLLRKIRNFFNIKINYKIISKIREQTYNKNHDISFYDNLKNKTKQTCLERYGVDNPYKNVNFQEKQKQTCLKKYGASYFLQSINYKNMYKNDKWNKFIQNKKHQTKKNNKSYSKSKQEDKVFELLIQKYPNTIRQYKSNLYPFPCDFYIPELNLYIEYNGFYMHGKEPYIGSSEQQEIIKIWESKNSSQYLNAIQTWTIRDPLKRQTAKDNKLNYLEFFNMKEFMEWYNQIL